MRSDVRIYTGIFLVILAALAVVAVLMRNRAPSGPVISNFQECAAAGYPVMQSYPRQCTLPNGKFFVEQVVPER